MESNMKRLIMAAAGIALIASVGTTSAQTSHKRGVYNSQGHFSQRTVGLRSAPLPNADLKYGPYPEYPQSPPGGGY
jgi:hypothetical protein